ncbi:MAG: hypothetical protein KDA21_00580 [Phycisphaerales bacterium]|nr:hypothetical protein [Phycisphaerales bacterium]
MIMLHEAEGRAVRRREAGGTGRACAAAAAASEPDLVARCHVLTLDVLQDGELILLDLRPHGASVLLRPVTLIWGAVVLVLLLGAGLSINLGGAAPTSFRDVLTILVVGTLALVIAQVLDLRKRRYILTDRRVLAFGTFGHLAMPLSAVRTLTLTRSRREHVFDLGTLHFKDHGHRSAVRWDMLGKPEEVRRAVEDCVERYARGDFERDGG